MQEKEEEKVTVEELKELLTDNEKFSRYRDDLKFLVDKAHAEYMTYESYTFPNQHGLIKTYLWIASVLFTAEMTLFFKLTENNYALVETFYQNQNPVPPTPFFYFYFASLCCAIGTFLFAIDTLRGREEKIIPFKNYEQDQLKAFEENYENGKTKLYDELIRGLEEALIQRTQICTSTGLKLRKMSKLLACGVINCIISILILLFPAMDFTYSNLMLSAILLAIPIYIILYYLINQE